MIQYEVWLTDEYGIRLELLDTISYLSYSRTLTSFGTIEFGLPFQPFVERHVPFFRPDWRVEVWRSPKAGEAMRLEDVFLLRKPVVYTRITDNMQMLRFYGRNGIDLLNRRHVIQRSDTSWALKTDYIDDMMKEIVRQQMLYNSALDEDGVQSNARAYPQNEFLVQSDAGVGPSVTRSFSGKRVYDVLRDLKESSFQLNESDSTKRRVYFTVTPYDVSGLNTVHSSRLGWQFETRADLFGNDRTTGILFSLENENIKAPEYSEDHLDEINSVYVFGNGTGRNSQVIEPVQDTQRISQSRWNLSEKIISASEEPGTSGLQTAGNAQLEKGRPQIGFPVEFLNTAGNARVPQSLYGIDWDLGDLLPVQYAGRNFNVEVEIVTVSLNDAGEENVSGRNKVTIT